MIPVLEAVPNFSEGRDLPKIEALVALIASAGVEVLDWSSDPDHHRTVVTYIGDPPRVEAASVAAARFAIEHFDLREHGGVHPRVGALDVLPFVPLQGVTMQEAVASAHRVGRELGGFGLPVFYYGMASDPPGRGLAALRRGGFEGQLDGFTSDLRPDEPPGARAPHPTAGVTCIGARQVLLAWNVFATGIDVEAARAIASKIREQGGGFPGLRALGLHLQDQDRVQISMNLEDSERTSPLRVFEAIENEVTLRGGQIAETQVIGMIPDTLVLPAAVDRLLLSDPGPARILSRRVATYASQRAYERTETPESAE